MGDFQKEDLIRKCSRDDVITLMEEAVSIEGGCFDKQSTEDWFSKSDRFLAAVSDNKIIGTVSYSTKGIEDKEMPVLDFVNVLRPFRKNGIATRLCIAAIKDLAAEGYSPIHCLTLNSDAHSMILSLPDEIKCHLVVKRGF